MKHFGSTLFVGACAFFAQATLANAGGDLLYPPVVEAAAPGVSGFYLRGQIGFSNHEVDDIYSETFDIPGNNFTVLQDGFETGGIFGLGAGYRWNRHLRFDVTGEYRGKATFHGLDRYLGFNEPLPGATNQYTGTLKGWVGLFNAYVDLGTWWCFTPYVGAGIGFAENEIGDFTDVNVNVPGGAVFYGKDNSETEFAWAIHAGVAYEVTPNLALDFGYRYTDLGDAYTGPLFNSLGKHTISGIEFRDLHSHDLMLSVRYQCCGTDAPIVPAYTSLK